MKRYFILLFVMLIVSCESGKHSQNPTENTQKPFNEPEPDSEFEKELQKVKNNSQIPIEKVQKFIPDKESINKRDSKTGNTPLLAAVIHNQKEIVKYLLDNAADVNAVFQYPGNQLINGYTALFAAVNLYQDAELVDILIKKGADLRINPPDAMPVVYWLLEQRHEIILEKFLEKDPTIANWNAQPDGTILHVAAKDPLRFDCIKLLLKYNADRTIKNKEGKTPWEFAHTDVKKMVPELNPNYVK